MFDLSPRVLRAAMATAALAAMVFLAAAHRAPAQTSAQPQAAASAQPAAGTPTRTRRSPLDRVEGQIKSFHDRLKITPEQDPQWQALAQAMRDNAKAMDALITKQSQNPRDSRTAVDQLHMHQDFAQAHVDGLKSFTPRFEALYGVLSDSQKKTADMMFQRERHGRHRHH